MGQKSLALRDLSADPPPPAPPPRSPRTITPRALSRLHAGETRTPRASAGCYRPLPPASPSRAPADLLRRYLSGRTWAHGWARRGRGRGDLKARYCEPDLLRFEALLESLADSLGDGHEVRGQPGAEVDPVCNLF